MIRKIKDILGIEGVRLEILCPDEIKESEGHIRGQLKIRSKSSQRLQKITIRLVEKYRRGREEQMLIDEYLLSSLDIETDIQLEKDSQEILDFNLTFNLLLSEMDQIAKKNPLSRGLIKLAKTLKNVKSYYRIEAIAVVEGSELETQTQKDLIIS